MRHLILLILFTLSPSAPAVTCESDFALNLDKLIADSKGLKIEVGAADRPMCALCLQVDRYRSASDLREGVFDPTDSNDMWAAARSGIIADARALPFARDSVSLIISKNFPWFGNDPQKIAAVLREYKRVSMKNGRIVLLARHRNPKIQRGRKPGSSESDWEKEDLEQQLDLYSSFRPHIEIAVALGFQVSFINEKEFFGLSLRKSLNLKN